MKVTTKFGFDHQKSTISMRFVASRGLADQPAATKLPFAGYRDMLGQNTPSSYPAPSQNGNDAVQRPNAVQTIGGALNQAYKQSTSLPDEFLDLLAQLDQAGDHSDGA